MDRLKMPRLILRLRLLLTKPFHSCNKLLTMSLDRLETTTIPLLWEGVTGLDCLTVQRFSCMGVIKDNFDFSTIRWYSDTGLIVFISPAHLEQLQKALS